MAKFRPVVGKIYSDGNAEYRMISANESVCVLQEVRWSDIDGYVPIGDPMGNGAAYVLGHSAMREFFMVA